MPDIKQLLSEMKKKETLRNSQLEELDAEMKRIDLREETETERFITGMEEDRTAGVYNHITDGKFQQLINEQKVKIEEKYNSQRAELKQQIEEAKKKHMEEKTNDYKQISAEIKDYHLEMVLKVSEEQNKLAQIEAERDKKLQEINDKIKQKEAARTHLIMQNRNFMDVETNEKLGEINSLEIEIEKLKDQKEAITNEYSIKIEEQNKTKEYYLQQKERASKLLGSVILSEKSIDEIYSMLYDAEPEREEEQEPIVETPEQEEQEQEQETPEQDAETIAQDIFRQLSEKDKEDLVVNMADLAIVYSFSDMWEQYINLPDATRKAVENKVREMCAKELEIETPTQETSEQEEPVLQAPAPDALESEEPTQKTPAQEPQTQGTTEHETFWDRIKRFAEERDGETVDTEEIGTPVAEGPKAPIDKIAVYIRTSGSQLAITRKGKTEWEAGRTPLDQARLKDIEVEIDSNLLEEAKEIGDEYVIRGILLELEGNEREEQLRKYISTLKGEYTENLPFKLNYYLKDVRKAGLSKDERKALLDNAKKVRDLNKTIEQETGVENALGEVEVPLLTKAKWLWQDSKIGKWFSRNLLPKGRDNEQREEQHQTEETEAVVEQEEAVQEEPGVEFDRLGNRITRTPEEISADEVAKMFYTPDEQTLENPSQDGESLE